MKKLYGFTEILKNGNYTTFFITLFDPIPVWHTMVGDEQSHMTQI